MWLLVVLVALALVFRRQIFKRPRLTAGLFLGLLCAVALLKVLESDPAWRSISTGKPGLAALVVLVVVVMAIRILRYIFDDVWPSDKNGGSERS